MGTGWARHTFFLKDTLPLSSTTFEGHTFPVPHDMEEYLTNVYGAWHNIPNEESIKRSIHCREYRREIYGNEE